MSRSTHMYISSLLSSFHLVNSCSVCPSDDMDKLNISYNILKNVYNYILQNLWSRFNKVSFNQVPINYVKAFFSKFAIAFDFVHALLCFKLLRSTLLKPPWHFFKNATRLNFVVWKNENILYQFVLVFQLLVVTAHTEPVRFARSKTGTLQQNFINVDKYVKGVK